MASICNLVIITEIVIILTYGNTNGAVVNKAKYRRYFKRVVIYAKVLI